MQVEKKKLIVIFVLIGIIACLTATIIVLSVVKNNSFESDYYYTYTLDDNKITQSVRIYSKKGKRVQTRYYILSDGSPVSYTKGEKAVLTIANLDLQDNPDITIAFEDDIEKLIKVVHKD